MSADPAAADAQTTGGCSSPQNALYGRRKGKKLRSRQSDLLASLLPRLTVPLNSVSADPTGLFGALRPSDIRLEIGFGGGEHLLSEARRSPATGFLGCEPFINGLAKILVEIEDQRIENIRLHPGDARELVAALPARSIAGVDLLFPDPWPKRRQHKRRFLSEETLAALARILRSGGELHFATDIDDYAGWALARVSRSTEFAWMAQSPSDWLDPWEGWAGTRYEARAISAGRRPVYLTFVRR